jgi:hypothetical protein
MPEGKLMPSNAFLWHILYGAKFKIEKHFNVVPAPARKFIWLLLRLFKHCFLVCPIEYFLMIIFCLLYLYLTKQSENKFCIGWLYEDCVRLARNYSLPPGRGSVVARIFPTNRGLRAAWFDGWRPQSRSDYAIIVEDDLELSVQWYSWLKKAWLAYRNREDLAGIALSRQYLMLQVLKYVFKRN